MTKPSNIESIEEATKKSWDEWVTYLTSKNAQDLPHADIVKLVREVLDIESAGWWSQNVTVAYEQHIGRRMAGQAADGTYETSVTKTLTGTREDVFDTLVIELDSLADIQGFTKINPRTSVTPKRSYWRCELENDSKITVAVEVRTPGKPFVFIIHSHIVSEEESVVAKAFWKNFLDTITL